ncbi:MAG TPA: DUF5666 domain-containing protein [Candidatus Acidoferrum sp.]|nr:DUF5666 domain-containing protein [Candidatus Acidoferrum sp.]
MLSTIPFFLQRFSALLALLSGIYIASGCSSGMSMNQPPPPPVPTSVTMLLSSTANDLFSDFNIDIASVTLMNKAGSSVNLIPAIQNNGFYQTQNVEFAHLNAPSALLVTAAVPQDVYTSASLTYTYTQFTYIFLNSNGGISVTTDAVGEANAIPMTAIINLPSPIAVSGSAMGLVLNLQQSASATLAKNGPGADTYTITPTFSLASAPIAHDSQLPKLTGLDGRITSASSGENKFTLKTVNGYSRPNAPAGSLFTIATDNGTAYQGVGGFSALGVGTFVNADLALQPDGSLLATRIEAEDPNATNVMIGPISFVYCACIASTHSLWDVGSLQQGSDLDTNPIESWGYSYDASTVFRISQQINIPANLPFPATFNSSTLVAGQNVSLSSLSISSTVRATTITLRPQTINGTVTAVSSAGPFTVYSVSLASYDLFPTLAVQPGQTTVLQNPRVVEVYADSSTELLNTNALAPGSVFRFNGLIFNDNGTLRMFGAQARDGVPE